MTNRSIVPGLFLLTAACGLIDAACFLGLGNVFAEIMTGNLMFMAFSIGLGNAVEAIPNYVVPFILFSFGALLGGVFIRRRFSPTQRRYGFVAITGLTVVACVLTWMWNPAAPTTQSMVIVAVLAFAMGLQNALVLHHAIPDIATNVMTLTMVRVISSWSVIGGTNERWQYRTTSLATFFLAALVGAATLRFGTFVPLAIAVLVYLVAMPWLLFGHSPVESSETTKVNPTSA